MWSIWFLDFGVIFESGEDFGRGEFIRRYRIKYFIYELVGDIFYLNIRVNYKVKYING